MLAEKRLQEFQESRDPIPACQHILQHSSMEHARFHAALTLRHAALRDWPLLTPDARAGVLMFVMQHLFGCVSYAMFRRNTLRPRRLMQSIRW